MNRHFMFGIILAVLLLLSGCGDSTNSDLETVTEENVANSATGTVREVTHIVKEEHLSSHYYGEANSEEEDKHILLIQKDIYDLQEGNSIVFGRTSYFPNGLIRKIESIQEYEGVIKVVTSQAALDDLFEDLNVTHAMRLKPVPIIGKDEQNIGSGDVIRVVHEEEGVSLSQNSDFIASLDETVNTSKKLDFTVDFNEVDLGHGVTINGSMDISLSFHMKVSFFTKCTHHLWGVCDDWKTELGHTYFYIEPKESGSITLSAAKDYSIDKEKTLAEYTFSAFDIQVGVVPIVIVPKLRLITDVNGDVTAGLSMGLTQDISSKIGITHKKKKHHSKYHWYSIKSMDHDFKMIPPEFNANSEVKVSTGPELEMLIYDVAGPTATLDTYLKADADLEANPWWTLYYGIEANAGFALDILDHEFANVNFTLYDYEKELAEAKGAFGE